ncbi:hypothetical protein M408DRAFT_277883 [Serendipita vermifera MAFF 305830]|uniref:RRM domain-containing protein n=1 Tax=Serendipita vermifera MAFF 305830 TaxID=933852 RepID=A0A0C3ARY2_SERVB|nr:hypothetical protein M408DRAFT_277883 [Serendipita vermifera MAFF 305830]
MQSPTALTPEPADPNLSAESSSASFESITSSTQQISISLTSSPLTVRTSEDTPIKSGYVARKVLQDILENISTTNNTPNKVIPSNETPLRATPLLTPPSSDERPQATFVSVDSLSSPSAAPPMKQVPLTEKILAQSALYFRAIQKQQKQPFPGSTTSSDSTHVADLVDRLRFDNLAQQIQQQQPPVPQLTYSQLQQQQQQQFFTRQFLNNPEGHKDSPDNNTKDKHAAADAHSLTAVELPNGNEVEESQGLATGVDADGANHIATIPKPDPLENPLNTTNVYINGLPLRWTDDDLYRLTRGFGAVKSVKLFTRHLEDKPSAYGFVLFNCVEDAERFIMTLRQHTSFHPSFAKTAKVPGTTNAKHAISDPVIPLPRGEDYADISITGLPLTIDMQTLRALFSPQVIKASKFFHTTGTPRRLVGFIRLEGPKAAQDIFDRLHGSNVLGWSENLSVQSLGSGTNLLPYPSEPLPSGSQTLKQENVSVARTAAGAQSSQTTPTQTPSIGVYQHQNVQINDFNRLFSSMQLSAAPHTIILNRRCRPFRPLLLSKMESFLGWILVVLSTLSELGSLRKLIQNSLGLSQQTTPWEDLLCINSIVLKETFSRMPQGACLPPRVLQA